MKRSKSSEHSDSDFDKRLVTDQEYSGIKDDVKEIKKVIKQIKQKSESLKDGVQGWFKHFDVDKSDMIELDEFIKMVQYLGIILEDRIGIMLFRIFDRSNQGYFGQTEFVDIIDKRMIPNYKRIIFMERERFRLEGPNIKLVKKKRPKP